MRWKRGKERFLVLSFVQQPLTVSRINTHKKNEYGGVCAAHVAGNTLEYKYREGPVKINVNPTAMSANEIK
jgi:hypothetical protein